MERKNAVIVAYGRSAIAKAIKGSLRYTGCADYGSQVLKGILAKYPGFDPEIVGVGASMGVDKGNYPTSKKVVFGVNITF